MNERERWIVYPLLFLALGAGLRDKLFDLTKAKKVECQQLLVWAEDRGGRQPVPLVVIGAEPQTGPGGRPVGALEVAGDLHARTIYAENFVCRGIPFGPAAIRGLQGMSPTDWLRALQQSAGAVPGNTATDGRASEEDVAAPQESTAAPIQPPSDATPSGPPE